MLCLDVLILANKSVFVKSRMLNPYSAMLKPLDA